MHTLFTLEDRYGLKICEWTEKYIFGWMCSKEKKRPDSMRCSGPGENRRPSWKSGEISKEDYDRWRYRYPEFDTSRSAPWYAGGSDLTLLM